MGRPPGVTTSSPTLMQNSRPMPAAASTSTTLHPSKEHTPASTLSARAPNLSASHIYPAASSGLALAAILCQAKSIHPGVFKAIPFPSSLTTTIPMSSKVACPPQPSTAAVSKRLPRRTARRQGSLCKTAKHNSFFWVPRAITCGPPLPPHPGPPPNAS